jgi:hypothetical protein
LSDRDGELFGSGIDIKRSAHRHRFMIANPYHKGATRIVSYFEVRLTAFEFETSPLGSLLDDQSGLRGQRDARSIAKSKRPLLGSRRLQNRRIITP